MVFRTGASYEACNVKRYFFGLAGEAGPLPMPYVDLILQQLSRRNYVLADFLDIFNHRLLSLIARNGRKHWPVLERQHPERSTFGKALISLCGFNPERLYDNVSVHYVQSKKANGG